VKGGKRGQRGVEAVRRRRVILAQRGVDTKGKAEGVGNGPLGKKPKGKNRGATKWVEPVSRWQRMQVPMPRKTVESMVQDLFK